MTGVVKQLLAELSDFDRDICSQMADPQNCKLKIFVNKYPKWLNAFLTF